MKPIVAAAVLAFTALSLMTAAPAAAVPTPEQICVALDADPTQEGLVRFIVREMPGDASQTEVELASENLVIAALVTCPRHEDLIVATADRIGGDLRREI